MKQPRGGRAVLLMGLMLLAGGCNGGADEEKPVPPATAMCDEVEFPRQQSGSHLIGDAEPPVPYSSSPPTSGWHSSGATPVGIYDEDDPLTEPQMVFSLEAGGVVVAYNGLSEADVATLEEAVAAPDLADRVVLTPYADIAEGEVTLTTWGALQRCRGVDLDALQAWSDAYAEPIAAHD